MTPHEEMARAMRARELLDNELLNEALSVLEKELIDAWEKCPTRDLEGKEHYWQLYKTAKKFRHVLNGYVESGKLASLALEREEEQSRLKRLFRIA